MVRFYRCGYFQTIRIGMRVNVGKNGHKAETSMRVLLACEESQAVTKEFRRLGHEAYSCDILPCSGGHPEWHIQGDVL